MNRGLSLFRDGKADEYTRGGALLSSTKAAVCEKCNYFVSFAEIKQLINMGKFWEGLAGNIPVVGGLIKGALDARTAKKNTDRTIEANKELAEYQYSKDLEMWKLGNEYNSPESQMQRFKDAGLNPNLIYGQGNAGNAATIPKYQAPKVDYQYRPAVDPLAILGAYQDFRMKQAQTKAAEAQANSADDYWKNKTTGVYEKMMVDYYKRHGLKMETDLKMNNFDDNITGKATPWQQAQLDFLKSKANTEDEKLRLYKAQGAVYEKNSQLLQKEIDWFLTKMWSGIITQGGNTLLKFK